MMIKSFQDIDSYRRAYDIALAVHKATLNFPSIEQYALADQMRRASKSVCANIAEGFARQHASIADFKRFLVISASSCDEMRVWLDFAKDLDYIPIEIWTDWSREYVELGKMISALRRNWKT